MKSRMRQMLLLPLLMLVLLETNAQALKGEAAKHEPKVRDMVAFLEYMLNTLGNEKTSARDKDVLITQSYTKIFRDAKVQIEDDLVEKRNVITNKDVPAYLKDVDFFFTNVKFEFHIESIQSEETTADKLFYKVKLTRNLKGTTVEGKEINNTMPRYIEINYNPQDQDLKIVSIYTNEFDEREALESWWNGLSHEWQSIFRRSINLTDSITLKDIKRMTTIDSLNLSNNKFIQRIEPLSQLLSLAHLNLANTNITDVSPIRNLTELVYLNLSDTRIVDISPLRYSAKLVTLNVAGTDVADIAVVEQLVNLRQLELAHTPVVDFSSLDFLDSLRYLDVSSTALTTLEVLGVAPALVQLNVSRTALSDVTDVGTFANLESLNLDSLPVSDITEIGKLKKLEVLYLNHTAVTSLEPLRNLKTLERVYCDNTPIDQSAANAFMEANPNTLVIFDSEDVRGWWSELSASWKQLLGRTAGISATPSKEELARVTNLDSINFAYDVSIRDLEPLRALPKLRVIIANKTIISDLTPLAALRHVQKMDISNTRISDLSVLASFKALKELHAENLSIQNFDTLAVISSMKKMYVDGCNIRNGQVQAFLRHNPECLVVYKTAELEQWWNNVSSTWKQAFQKQLPMQSPFVREYLHRLVELEKVQLANIAVDDLTVFDQFIRLKELSFSGTHINSLGPLFRHRTLEVLRVNDNPVRNLGPLAELGNLRELDISNTAVDDLEVLKNLQQLTVLNCAGTQIKKLNTLEKIKGLESLDCSNTEVKSLNPVSDLSLSTLKCYNTRISARKVEQFKTKNPECKVTYYR
ncbi:MAG TPA: leucine-rich repeat domain-containing protein [Ohtaekwangia sp.]|nr:leucine-rich repeat domain-containing protein [Ohtaekwangia sp.]